MDYKYKHKLIISLGGFAYYENDEKLQEVYGNGFVAGQTNVIKKLYNIIKGYYGLSEQEWIDKVWDLITYTHFMHNAKDMIDES